MEEFLIETCVEQMLRDDDDETIPPDLQVALNAEMMRGASNLGVSFLLIRTSFQSWSVTHSSRVTAFSHGQLRLILSLLVLKLPLYSP